jgi:hypothetical protein
MIKIKEITPKNICAFIQGNYRFYIWYTFPKLRNRIIRKHILEQVEYRVNSMNRDCYNNGFCKCGCKTINLQFADKTCTDICYPAMVSERMWDYLKKSQKDLRLNGFLWKLDIVNKRFMKISF